MNVADFKLNRAAPLSGVKYWLYQENGDKVKTLKRNALGNLIEPVGVKKTDHGACFISVASQLKANPDFNRIVYFPRNQILTEAKGIEWIELCVKSGILPNYINPKSLKEGYVLKLTDPRSLTYIYLCHIRYLDEEPDFVEACLHLVKVEKISIYAALAICCKSMTAYTGHNYYGTGSLYSGSPSIDGTQVTLKSAIGLRNFMLEPTKYDKGQKTFGAKDVVESAIAQTPIDPNLTLNWAHFQRPSMKKVFKTKTKETLDKAIVQYNKGLADYQKRKAKEKTSFQFNV